MELFKLYSAELLVDIATDEENTEFVRAGTKVKVWPTPAGILWIVYKGEAIEEGKENINFKFTEDIDI